MQPSGDGTDGVSTADARPSVEYAKCAADFAYFAHTYGQIDEPQRSQLGHVPFELWPDQWALACDLMLERLIVILKARQLGISWLCCAYALWLCMFERGRLVLLFSQGEDEAKELLRKVIVLYERLPEWLRTKCPLVQEPNSSIIEWVNRSRVESLPSTQKAGRSRTASLIILDECAFILYAKQLFGAVKPTIDGGGKMIVLSTANGIGNMFHKLYTQAVAGRNGFKAIFLPWWSRPDRDPEFRNRIIAQSTDPDGMIQEYPESAIEAFIVSGRPRFRWKWVEQQSGNVRQGLPNGSLPISLRDILGLTVYRLPTPKASHTVISADVAEGLEHGDYSAAVLLDSESLEELATLHGHWEPDEYGELLSRIAEIWDSEILVERNNHGHATIATLRTLCPHRIARGVDGKEGWLTNLKTKPQAIDVLAGALRDEVIVVRSQAALDEFLIYQIGHAGRTGAPEGHHDDLVMAWANGLGWLAMVGSRVATWGPDPFDERRR